MPIAFAKICGLSTTDTLDAALDGRASHVGFVTFPKSPRHLAPASARPLRERARGRASTVSVLVDPDDALVEAVLTDLAPDLIQLHGAETPARAAAIRARGVGVVKAIGVSEAADLDRARAFEDVVDALLFDAKPPKDAALPGGLGHAFDWTALAGFATATPWFLSGGLDADNVARAVAISGAPGVDVSSGVETAPGLKDATLIAAFLAALRDRAAG